MAWPSAKYHIFSKARTSKLSSSRGYIMINLLFTPDCMQTLVSATFLSKIKVLIQIHHVDVPLKEKLQMWSLSFEVLLNKVGCFEFDQDFKKRVMGLFLVLIPVFPFCLISRICTFLYNNLLIFIQLTSKERTLNLKIISHDSLGYPLLL